MQISYSIPVALVTCGVRCGLPIMLATLVWNRRVLLTPSTGSIVIVRTMTFTLLRKRSYRWQNPRSLGRVLRLDTTAVLAAARFEADLNSVLMQLRFVGGVTSGSVAIR